MKSDFVPVSIRFPREMYEWLRKSAFERRTGMNTLIREAVDEARKAGRTGKKERVK